MDRKNWRGVEGHAIRRALCVVNMRMSLVTTKQVSSPAASSSDLRIRISEAAKEMKGWVELWG